MRGSDLNRDWLNLVEREIVEQLCAAYFVNHSTPSQTIFDDIEAVPFDYINNELAAGVARSRTTAFDTRTAARPPTLFGARRGQPCRRARMRAAFAVHPKSAPS